MLRKISLVIALIIVTLMLLTACERGEKGERGEDEIERAAAPAATKSTQPPVNLPAGRAASYNFDNVGVGNLPSNFTSALTGAGEMGNWTVLSDDSASSKPNVLAQTSSDRTDYRFPLVVSNDGVFKDLELSVKFKPIGGTVDEAGGLVLRYLDENNYYILRANALEDNCNLYRVTNGRRQQFAGENVTVTPRQWHELKIVAIGDQFTCFLDGKQVIQATDETFKEAGRVGMWTKADSVTYFDDFTVTPK